MDVGWLRNLRLWLRRGDVKYLPSRADRFHVEALAGRAALRLERDGENGLSRQLDLVIADQDETLPDAALFRAMLDHASLILSASTVAWDRWDGRTSTDEMVSEVAEALGATSDEDRTAVAAVVAALDD